MNKPNQKRRFRKNRSKRPTMEKPASSVELPEGMVFYCKNRKQILDINPKTFDFKSELKEYARKTQTEDIDFDVVFGTERSIKQYYKIADEKFDQERREREMKAAQADKL
ncbi:hypothetical protein GF376_02025 [Candidatus Peregrinibacteria bacterium]|nr:hypothetical protein [Candidatus Peregrinibacteria bacterium]